MSADPKTTKPLILVIDDEEENCKLLVRMLRREYEILSALSGEEGIELLKDHPEIGLIVTDMRMPGIQGNEVLIQAKALYPCLQGVILTGYADVALALSAINEGQAFGYLTKPIDQKTLLDFVKRAYRSFLQAQANQALIERLRAVRHKLNSDIQALLALDSDSVD